MSEITEQLACQCQYCTQKQCSIMAQIRRFRNALGEIAAGHWESRETVIRWATEARGEK